MFDEELAEIRSYHHSEENYDEDDKEESSASTYDEAKDSIFDSIANNYNIKKG